MIIKEEFLPTKRSIPRCIILISMILGIYILENSPIPSIIGSNTFSYIIKPILWGGVVLTVWLYPRTRAYSTLRLRSIINLWAFNFAVIYIIVSILIGLFIEGLGKSPYSHSPIGIVTNIFFVGSMLLGRELVRSYLVNSSTKEENFKLFIIVALFITITSISFKSYINIKGYEDLVKFIAETLAPEFSENLFATYLVFLGGPLPSIIYMGTVLGFHWFSPILPDLQWITKALIGVMGPTFFLMSMQDIYLNASKQIQKSDKQQESPVSWLITSVVSISIVWFAVGVFPIYPSVIATGSMEPMIKPGDVILVKKIVNIDGINNLKVGDVIQFKRDSILISHRIIEIKNDEKDGLGFKTKGDNNTAVDAQIVKPENVKGTIVYTVPKIGWPTLLIKSKEDIPLEEVVF